MTSSAVYLLQTSSHYVVLSRSTVVPRKPDCRGALLPYKDVYVYAAYESSDEQDYTYTIYDSKPDFLLSEFISVLDVSSRMVMMFLYLILRDSFKIT